ncbi:MAG: extracellular solute-binding protein [Streptosporangiales bacterium]|nr:extracellular solute-binding protein [Streptosporangiales bacterium]MBO0892674.1 extracellular solute-binding protein [Acidothermales bacterium]
MSVRSRLPRGVLAAVALCAVAVAGCGSGGSGGGEAKVLNVVLVNTPWARAITPHIPEFEKQTGIKVKLEQYAQEQARDKIFVSLSSHSSDLDVFNVLPSNEGLKWQASGLMQPLDDDLAKAKSDYDAKGFTKTMLNASRVGGQLVGIPVNVEGPVVYYRKDVLKKYGVAVPKTLAQLVAAAQSVSQKSHGKYVTATRGMSPTVTYTFGNVLHNYGVAWTGADGKPSFTDPRATQAIQDYATLAGKSGPKGAVNNGPPQDSALMASGKAAFEIDSSNELDSVVGSESSVGKKVGVMALPAGPGGSHPTLLSWNLGISKFTKHSADAWKFVQWATSPSMMVKLAAGGIAPPRDKLWSDPTFLKPYNTPAKKEWIAAVRDIISTGTGKVGPPAKDQDSARKVIGDEIDKVILGKETAQQASANIQKGLTPLLS